jgi:hypothetical protein
MAQAGSYPKDEALEYSRKYEKSPLCVAFLIDKKTILHPNHGMPSIGISRNHPIVGRLVFYSVVVLGLGGLNQLLPDSNSAARKRDVAAGVAMPMIAVPLSELPLEVRQRMEPAGKL